LGDKIDKNEMGGECSMYEERRGVYMVMVGIPEGKIPLGIPRRSWEDNINIFWVIKSIRMRWAGNVACMRRREAYTW
jgi:hypothetical protein